MLGTIEIAMVQLKAFGQRYRAIIFYAVLLAFIIGVFIAAKALNLRFEDLTITPLLIAIFISQPILILLNSFEYRLCSKVVNVEMNSLDALYVTCSASLANILPLPAGLVIRGGALVQRGATVSFVSTVLIVAGIMWMGVAMLVSGVFISDIFASRLIGLAGSALIIGSFIYIARISDAGLAFLFLFVRGLMVIVLTLQLQLCFAALGEVVPLRSSAVYVVSGIAGAVVSIVPAGLGLVEAFGALLAKLDGASPALAYIVLSLNRLIAFMMVGVGFFIFAKMKSNRLNTKTPF